MPPLPPRLVYLLPGKKRPSVRKEPPRLLHFLEVMEGVQSPVWGAVATSSPVTRMQRCLSAALGAEDRLGAHRHLQTSCLQQLLWPLEGGDWTSRSTKNQP